MEFQGQFKTTAEPMNDTNTLLCQGYTQDCEIFSINLQVIIL